MRIGRSMNFFTWLGFILFSLFSLFPLIWGLRTSLAGKYDYKLIPEKLTFEYYSLLFQRPELWLYLRNSLIVTLTSIIIVLPVAVLGAYALARFNFKGRKYGIVFLVLPMLPPVALLVPLISYMNNMGLYNTFMAVILANVIFNMPFSIWMLRNFIMATPHTIEEAGLVDGCSKISVLWRVAIPMMLPGLVDVSLFVFINSWSNYLYAFALTSSPNIRVLPQGVLAFLGSWGTNWGGLTAIGIITLIPPVVFFLIFQNWFVAGMFGQQLK
jgi:multiple sugar transport system permease protein